MNSVECYFNGKYCPWETASLSISDIGFIHGATITEQLRTIGGRLFLLNEHLQRFENGVNLLNINLDITISHLGKVAAELTEKFLHTTKEPECGLGFFATPGITDRFGQNPGAPQYCLYCYRLPEDDLLNPFGREFQLKIPEVKDVDPTSWPKNIKSRSRLHYYLADLEFQNTPYTAILSDKDGFLRDTSVSSPLFFFQPDQLTLPPAEDILNSVSLEFCLHLARLLDIKVERRAVHRTEIEQMSAIGLANSLFCLGKVSEIEGKALDLNWKELDKMIELWKSESMNDASRND